MNGQSRQHRVGELCSSSRWSRSGASMVPDRRDNRGGMRLGLLASFFVVLATASNTAGGGSASSPPSGATGLWSRAASLATGREEHTATLLPNGKVLVARGP